jgi:hypothetical protein
MGTTKVATSGTNLKLDVSKGLRGQTLALYPLKADHSVSKITSDKSALDFPFKPTLASRGERNLEVNLNSNFTPIRSNKNSDTPNLKIQSKGNSNIKPGSAMRDNFKKSPTVRNLDTDKYNPVRSLSKQIEGCGKCVSRNMSRMLNKH